MARCLIIGCGCRGRALAGALKAEGHVVRGTTRRPAQFAAIEAVGAEPVLGDPDRMSTITPALAHVTIAYILLGSADGTPESVEALHGTRLEMLMLKVLDTTVRGVIYEGAGTVPAPVLVRGRETVKHLCETSRIPYRVLERKPSPYEAWLDEAAAAAEGVLLG